MHKLHRCGGLKLTFPNWFNMLQLNYSVRNAGWAFATVSNGEAEQEFAVSYLHDSLQELAGSAIAIQEKALVSVVFMDEPGEHVLRLERTEGSVLDFELRWYKDWWSWGLMAEDEFECVLRGQTTVPKYVNQVRAILQQIHAEMGPRGYLEKWQRHEFPMAEFERLG